MNETPKESNVGSPANNTGTLQSLDTRTKFFKKEEKQRQIDTNPRVSDDKVSAMTYPASQAK